MRWQGNIFCKAFCKARKAGSSTQNEFPHSALENKSDREWLECHGSRNPYCCRYRGEKILSSVTSKDFRGSFTGLICKGQRIKKRFLLNCY